MSQSEWEDDRSSGGLDKYDSQEDEPEVTLPTTSDERQPADASDKCKTKSATDSDGKGDASGAVHCPPAKPSAPALPEKAAAQASKPGARHSTGSLANNRQKAGLPDTLAERRAARPSSEAVQATRAQQAASASAGARPLKVPSPEAVQAARSEQEEMARIREENIKAMLNDTVSVCRASVMPKLLQVKEGELQLRKAFTSPQDGQPAQSTDLKRRLSAMRRFVPWGSSKGFVLPSLKPMGVVSSSESESIEEPKPDPVPEVKLENGVEPLVVWTPGDGVDGAPVAVDNMLTTWLRAHQREGVQFMFDCVTGLKAFDGQGCILADDMGLGKTLQGITLMWTLLQGGHPILGGVPIAKRVMIVCPTSLVNNWDSECNKWLQGRVKTLPLCESSREDVICSVKQFLSPARPYHVIIISYETFRIHAALFAAEGSVDLLICDEAHRLKNDDTKTNKALDSLPCKRRVLLSGTPMQNHLDEFYAMVNFCNPGVLGDAAKFRKYYEAPILASREPFAADAVVAKGEERSAELSAIVNDFILRRTNKLLSAHLPPKLVEVVCCKMTDLQRDLYCHFLESKAAARLLKAGKGGTNMLSAITSLKKLCNHPKLIYDVVNASSHSGDKAVGFEGCNKFFPPGLFDNGRAGRGGLPAGWENLSGKMAIMARMLDILWKQTTDKIVIVSNYTQTLDLIGTLCRENNYPFVRLDGSTTINKRQKLVEAFCDPSKANFVFLLSSKAGGCGLNLVGANRLVLFDPDWNPATDKQAAARVWRDGQRRHVYVYRFVTTGTLEEKVFQRQLSKEGLSNVVNQSGKSAASMMSSDELADLFTLRTDTISDTYDSMASFAAAEEAAAAADAAPAAAAHPATDPTSDAAPEAPPRAVLRDQIGHPTEEEVKDWSWHSSTQTVDDDVLKLIGDEHISFVFSLHVDGMPVKEPCGLQSKAAPAPARAAPSGAPGRASSSRASFAAPQRTGGQTVKPTSHASAPKAGPARQRFSAPAAAGRATPAQAAPAARTKPGAPSAAPSGPLRPGALGQGAAPAATGRASSVCGPTTAARAGLAPSSARGNLTPKGGAAGSGDAAAQVQVVAQRPGAPLGPSSAARMSGGKENAARTPGVNQAAEGALASAMPRPEKKRASLSTPTLTAHAEKKQRVVVETIEDSSDDDFV